MKCCIILKFFDSYSIFIQIVKGVGTDWFAYKEKHLMFEAEKSKTELL
jgi:hypothetical protein